MTPPPWTPPLSASSSTPNAYATRTEWQRRGRVHHHTAIEWLELVGILSEMPQKEEHVTTMVIVMIIATRAVILLSITVFIIATILIVTLCVTW